MKRKIVFLVLCALSTCIFIWLLYQGNWTFDSQSTIYVLIGLLVCTIALIIWLPVPIKKQKSLTRRRNHWLFFISALIFIGAIFLSRNFLGSKLLFGLPVIAAVVILILRVRISRKEVIYAMVLSFLAAAAGLGAKWVDWEPITWSVLQFFLVFSGLIAGWMLLKKTGLWHDGIGRSRFLDNGLVPALRSFGFGILISIPWALGNILLGSSNSETWVQSWWQPFTAINAGVAEEAWARIFLIPLLYLLLRNTFRNKTAYMISLIILCYWFAYLHTSGGAESLFSTLMIGTLYSLPLCFICLHRDFETAVGFHFSIDFLKFAAALLINQKIWS